MDLVLYDTLTKKKRPFEPIDTEKKVVRMYVCGPTVYDYLHIGNFRGAIFFNMVRNWIEKQGYQVNYVYNYTDVDDKIIKRANDEGVESKVISERYIEAFEEDYQRLGLRPHTKNPRVTEVIPQIVAYVDQLIKNKKAYVVDGEVFYSIDSFESYGSLSGKKLEDLNAGERVDVDNRKQNPLDFVLWKPSKEGEPSWDSPWGPGRPGWHIECSAMIKEFLGETIDIHGGGIDLIFPHHENERAQGEGCCNQTYCNYWMHNEFINLKNQKMSKSLGNVITARAFMDQYHPEILKAVMLSGHYRTMFNVNEEKINLAISGLSRVYHALKDADAILSREGEGNGDINDGKPLPQIEKLASEMDKKITTAMNDDFNTQEVFAALFEMVRAFNATNLIRKQKHAQAKLTALYFKNWLCGWGGLLAVYQENPINMLNALNDILIREREIDVKRVEELIEQRTKARGDKDWSAADNARDELDKIGIEISDGESGTVWSVKI